MCFTDLNQGMLRGCRYLYIHGHGMVLYFVLCAAVPGLPSSPRATEVGLVYRGGPYQ